MTLISSDEPKDAMRCQRCECGAHADYISAEDGQPYCGNCFSDREPACTACGSRNEVDTETNTCPPCKAKGY